MRLIPLYLILVFALAACGTDEPPPPDPEGAEPKLRPEPDAQEPEVATRDDDEALEEVRQRRERLREEMREHRRTAVEDDRGDRTRTMTEAETDWWQDEALIAELGLDEHQLGDIEEAAATHRQTHQEGRRQMVELRRQLSRDLAEEGEEGPAEARQQREQLRRELEAADRDWQSALENILDPSQLEQLEATRPDALSPGTRHSLDRSAEESVEDEPSPPPMD